MSKKLKNNKLNVKKSFSNVEFCCNPFGKASHKSWRNSKKLTSITEKIYHNIIFLKSDSAAVIGDKICASCRLNITRLMKKKEDSSHNCSGYESALNDETFGEPQNENPLKKDIIAKLFEILDIQLSIKKYMRSENSRVNLFRILMEKIKNLLDLDCEFYLKDDINFPVVKSMIETFKSSKSVVKYQILTLLVNHFTTRDLMSALNCSKYLISCFRTVTYKFDIVNRSTHG